jgi:type II secretory pathway pseudopilin PulG
MRIQFTKKSQRGTSLVDVVVATFIVGTMAVGIIGSFTYGFYIMRMARENQRATQILLERVETVRLYSWDQVVTPGFIPTTFTEVFDPQAPSGSRGVSYQGSIAVTNVPFASTYSDNMRQLVVSLNWTTQGQTRNRRFSTFISKDGVQNYVY